MARVPTMFDKLDFAPYRFVEFPKVLYAPGGGTVEVKSETEEAALVGDWFTTPAEARAAKAAE